MEQAYAQALWKLLESGMSPKRAVSSLNELLARHGRAKLFPRIARAFERLAGREARRNEVILRVAREGDARRARKEISDIVQAQGIESAAVETRVEENLIGGWRLEGRERLIDNSFKKHLLSIYTAATK